MPILEVKKYHCECDSCHKVEIFECYYRKIPDGWKGKHISSSLHDGYGNFIPGTSFSDAISEIAKGNNVEEVYCPDCVTIKDVIE